MPEYNLIRALLEQSNVQESKTNVLRPVGWIFGICVAATLTSFTISAPVWVSIMFAVFSCLTLLLYLGSYMYCLLTDKDALRSEQHTLQKMAIERGIIGDKNI